ncbi:carbon-nitrogen hydrolase family protein [Treponema berlinense]|uniref:carbon-nitrogen hydrolase family protein n=1 Tax=Treponema berlinense TaxID=225004 RepID=UPI0026F12346|nr:carbon-nitrogen hydrolase family protein [Treponema berlinense]
MKLALVQMKGKNTNDENMEIALKKISEAAATGADIVVLPEMFSCPYKASNFPVYAQPDGGENWQKLSDCAKKHEIYLVAGSMPESSGTSTSPGSQKIYNTSYVFNRKGEQIAKHRKMHLFDCDIPSARFHESDTLSAGNGITVFDTEFGKIGLMICFDIRFPELSRLMADRGARLVIVPAAFNMTSGPAWWELMFRTRATDNQFFMAGCSPARDEKAGYVAWGHSIFVDPFGKVLAQLDEKEAILCVDVDLKQVEDFRRQYKILAARRKDIYRLEEVRV